MSMSYYNEINPPSVYEEECSCSNGDPMSCSLEAHIEDRMDAWELAFGPVPEEDPIYEGDVIE